MEGQGEAVLERYQLAAQTLNSTDPPTARLPGREGAPSEIGSTSTIMGRERVSAKDLTDVVKEIMWNIDIALPSYVKLRPRFVQRDVGGAAGYANRLGSSGGYTELNQRLTRALTFCCYSGAPRRPSTFVHLTSSRFEEQIGECFKWVEELEQLVQMKNGGDDEGGIGTRC